MTEPRVKGCPTCSPGQMTYETRRTVVTYKGRSKEYELTAWWCDHCDEALLDAEGQEMMFAAGRALRAEIAEAEQPPREEDE